MALSAPTKVVFLVSLVIFVIGLLSGLGLIAFIPLASFWILTIAYAVLAVGCLLKGV